MQEQHEELARSFTPIPCDCGCGTEFSSIRAYAEHKDQVHRARLADPCVEVLDASPNTPEPELPADASAFLREIWPDFLETRKRTQQDWNERHPPDDATPTEPRGSTATTARPRTGSRPRSTRSRSATSRRGSQSRAPDGDREPPPRRICAGCDQPFTPRRKDQLTHDDVCRQRACRKRILIQRLALELVYRGEITGEDALALVIQPTKAVLDALKARAMQQVAA